MKKVKFIIFLIIAIALCIYPIINSFILLVDNIKMVNFMHQQYKDLPDVIPSAIELFIPLIINNAIIIISIIIIITLLLIILIKTSKSDLSNLTISIKSKFEQIQETRKAKKLLKAKQVIEELEKKDNLK